jgi:hypothetical protein
MIKAGGTLFQTEATPEEAARFRRLADTVTATVGNMQQIPGKLAKPAIGSGVLARIGGVDFVLTAGHNLEDCRLEEIFVAVPHGQVAFNLHPGTYLKGVVRREAGDPDVAVLELDPEKAALWSKCEPIIVDEFGAHEDVGPVDRILVCGCPYADVSELEPVLSPIVGGEASPAFSVLFVPYTTRIARDFRSEDPTQGRGFCVHYGNSVFESGREDFVHPRGFSGGPVLAVEGGHRTLLGFARSFSAEHFELCCEPSWCALKFLRDCHPNPAVVADAGRGLELLGR